MSLITHLFKVDKTESSLVAEKSISLIVEKNSFDFLISKPNQQKRLTILDDVRNSLN